MSNLFNGFFYYTTYDIKAVLKVGKYFSRAKKVDKSVKIKNVFYSSEILLGDFLTMYELVCWTIPVKIWVEIEIWCLLPCLISHRKGGLKLHHQIMRSIFVYSSKTSRLLAFGWCIPWAFLHMFSSCYCCLTLVAYNTAAFFFLFSVSWHHSIWKSYQKVSFYDNTSKANFLIFTLFKTCFSLFKTFQNFATDLFYYTIY